MQVMRKEPPLPVQDEKLLMRMIKAGFGMRRKTLTNALKGTVDGEVLRAALDECGISQTIRAEALSVLEWIALSNACSKKDA